MKIIFCLLFALLSCRASYAALSCSVPASFSSSFNVTSSSSFKCYSTAIAACSQSHSSCSTYGTPNESYFFVAAFDFNTNPWSAEVYIVCGAESTSPSCTEDLCEDEKNEAVQLCGGEDRYLILNEINCTYKCIPPCQDKFAEALSVCGDLEFVVWESHEFCNYHCKDCEEEYQAAKSQCSSPVKNPNSNLPCSYICGCEQVVSQAEAACPYGFDLNSSTCVYTCKDCPYFTDKCVSDCSPLGGVRNNYCHTTDGKVDEVLCECNETEKGCDAFWSACSASCKGRGGVGSSSYCNGSGGSFLSKLCVCKENESGTPQEPPVPPENPDPDPPVDPEHPDNSDLVGWLEKIKHNGDLSNDYLGNIAENIKRGIYNQEIINRTNQENFQQLSDNIVNAVNGLKGETAGTGSNGLGVIASSLGRIELSLNDVSSSVQGIKGALGPSGSLYQGLSNVGITAGTGLGAAGNLGTGGEVTGEGYGAAPAAADLPTAQQTASEFGVFVPRTGDDDYKAQISTKISSLSVVTFAPACLLSLSVPLPQFSSSSITFTWQQYPVDFCQFESFLAAVGNLLVFATALHELYKFSSN